MALTDEQKHFREIVRAFHTDCVLHPGGWGTELVPLWRDWTDIFVHEVSLLMGDQVYQMLGEPNDGLTDYQKMEVERLKHQIRDKQIKVEKGVAMQKNKILIEEREDGTLIGISRDGVDPYVKKVGLTWEQTLSQLPFLKGMTDIAEEGWKISPKNPSYAAPPKPEVKKVEPAKAPAKKAPAKKGTKKPEQPALEPEQQAIMEDMKRVTPNEKNPVPSVAEATTIKPSESVAKEPVKTTDAKILAPIPSGAEATTNEPGLVDQTATQPVTLTPSGTTPGGTPEIKELPKTRVSADAFQYKLKDGRGPFADVQLAMDALGIDKATRPTHNRYDRLSKKLQEEIIRETK